MRLNFRRNILFVKGASRAAIYDLNRSKIFWLSKDEKQLLDHLLEKEIDLPPAEENQLINELIKNNLCHLEKEKHDYNLHLARGKEKITPHKAWFELDTGCNHKCIHCYNHSGPASSNFILKDSAKSKDYIREIRNNNITELSFIGGEPLVHEKTLKELILYSRKLSFNSLSVFTNGTLIDKDWSDFFFSNEIKVFVTIYSHLPEVHDEITKTKSAFTKTISGLYALKDADCFAGINFIITPQSEHTIKETENFFKMTFPTFNFQYDYIRPSGRAIPLYQQLKFSHLNRFRELEQGGFFMGISEKEYMENKFYNSCLKDKILINSMGMVGNCIMLRDYNNNLNNESLENALKSKEFRFAQELSLSQIESCRDCEFRYACSDCRPIALNLTNNMMSKPPECVYDPYTGIYNNQNITL